MADTPKLGLIYQGNCPDCGTREVFLPAALPEPGDDYDWRVRDYDGFRMFMLEELSARFPERKRWTPADIEVVLVEVLSTVLDQLSDMLDRVATEAYLETARRPDTVRQLLDFIGFDAVAIAKKKDQISGDLTGQSAINALEEFWQRNPHAMQQAKRSGPQNIHTQKRMVTTQDYATRLREHPLVLHAHSWKVWSGSWYRIRLAVISWGNLLLDAVPGEELNLEYTDQLKNTVINFHEGAGIPVPDFTPVKQPTVRMVLKPYLDAFRMIGQEVVLEEPVYIGIYMSISVKVGSNFFKSEIQHEITRVLGHGPSGFFEPGNHGFGEDLYASDIIETLMTLDGIEHVCLNRFKRIGGQYPDRSSEGYIALDGLEVVACNNESENPEYGYYRLKLHGGRKG